MHFRRIKPSAVFGVNKPSGLPVYKAMLLILIRRKLVQVWNQIVEVHAEYCFAEFKKASEWHFFIN